GLRGFAACFGDLRQHGRESWKTRAGTSRANTPEARFSSLLPRSQNQQLPDLLPPLRPRSCGSERRPCRRQSGRDDATCPFAEEVAPCPSLPAAEPGVKRPPAEAHPEFPLTPHAIGAWQ